MKAKLDAPLSRRRLLLGAGAVLPAWALGSRFADEPVFAANAATPAPLRKSKIIENQWIKMPDGVNLAARIILPEDAEQRPVGGVFEYVPYRKRDWTREADTQWGKELAARGFALVRVDIRGSGDSEGVIEGEYLEPEQSDALCIIRWISAQPWCNGAVDMRGKSWGAFSALHAAAAAPPELKAIVSICGSENRYLEDSHYLGGALLIDNLVWGAMFDVVASGPPDPLVVGSRWREMWNTRLQAAGPNANRWLHHPHADAFWQNGTYDDYSKIKCATYVVEGLVDPYIDSIPRLLSRLSCPRKGLVGPWGHATPTGKPGPGLDWIYEEARWWDRWLNGNDNGIMSEPMLRSFMAHAAPARQYPQDTPGRWIADQSWPSADVTLISFFLSRKSLSRRRVDAELLTYRSRQTVGLKTVWWVPTVMEQELPQEQSADDKLCLLFDSPELDAPVEILGNPVARIRVRSDSAVAKIVVRLTEVDREGRSWLVSYGALNLTHHTGHARPTALVPGQDYDVEVPLYFAARRFEKGSRIRVAISENLWPLLWPSPGHVTLQITTGVSELLLPIRKQRGPEARMPIPQLPHQPVEQSIDASVGPKGMTIEVQGPEEHRKVRITQDNPYAGGHLADINLDMSVFNMKIDYQITEGEPNSAVWSGAVSCSWSRPGWKVEVQSTFELKSDGEEFHLREGLKAIANDQIAFEKVWSDHIKRQLL